MSKFHVAPSVGQHVQQTQAIAGQLPGLALARDPFAAGILRAPVSFLFVFFALFVVIKSVAHEMHCHRRANL